MVHTVATTTTAMDRDEDTSDNDKREPPRDDIRYPLTVFWFRAIGCAEVMLPNLSPSSEGPDSNIYNDAYLLNSTIHQITARSGQIASYAILDKESWDIIPILCLHDTCKRIVPHRLTFIQTITFGYSV